MARIEGAHYSTEKEHNYSLLISLIINAAILAAVFIFTDLMYETNDEFGIAAKIADGFPYIGFVNYYLCEALIFIQKYLTGINVFVLSQIVMSFFSYTALLKVYLDNRVTAVDGILAAVVIAFYSLDHYSSLQFTKTSALLMAAGLIVLADTYTHNRSILGFLAAIFLFYIGVGYRERGMFPSLAFAGIFMIIWFFRNRKEFYEGRSVIAEILLFIVIAALAVAPYGIDKMSDKMNASTPELKAYREYQAERVKITDYPLYEYYEENSDKYDAIGLSENDVYLVSHWFLDYDGAASYDNLVKINEINYPCVVRDRSVVKAAKQFASRVVSSAKDRGFTAMHIAILIVLSIYILLTVRPGAWWYMIFIGAAAAGMYVLIFYLGRAQYRAFYVMDVSATMWMLYVLAQREERWGKSKGRIFGILVCLLATAAVCVLFVPARENLINQSSNIRDKIQSDEMTQFYIDHEDTFYVCTTGSKKRHPSYLTPLKVPVVERNATGTGGWGTLAPYELEQLAEYGMTNLVGDLIDNDNAIYLGRAKQKRLAEYYNKWYAEEGTTIRFVKLGEVGDKGLYKVVREPQQ